MRRSAICYILGGIIFFLFLRNGSITYGIVAIGLLLITKLSYELNTLETKHQLIEKRIRDVFVKTLPNEQKIVNELVQMNQQLDAVQAEYRTLVTGLSDRVSPLRILQNISEKITPNQNVLIDDISIT